MRRVAMILDGVVVNVALVDEGSAWNPVGYELVEVSESAVGPGWTYEGGLFVEPVVEPGPGRGAEIDPRDEALALLTAELMDTQDALAAVMGLVLDLADFAGMSEE